MGCGCKKNKTTQTVAQPTEVTVNIDETQLTNQTPTLTEEQQKTVDEIIARLNQVNS